MSVTDSAAAAQYGLQAASLSPAGEDTPDRTFVAPDSASLLAGEQAMVPSKVPGVLQPDPTSTSADAYPLTMLTYAADDTEDPRPDVPEELRRLPALRGRRRAGQRRSARPAPGRVRAPSGLARIPDAGRGGHHRQSAGGQVGEEVVELPPSRARAAGRGSSGSNSSGTDGSSSYGPAPVRDPGRGSQSGSGTGGAGSNTGRPGRRRPSARAR